MTPRPLLSVLQKLSFERPTFQGFKWYIERTSVHGFKVIFGRFHLPMVQNFISGKRN